MIALILRGNQPSRVFPSVEARDAFLAEFPLQDGETLAEDATHDTVPDGNAYVWNGTAFVLRSIVVPAAPPETRLTVVQFRERFTDEEKDRIELAQTEHPDPMVRARLRRAEKELNSVQNQIADRAYPALQRAVAWMTTVTVDGTENGTKLIASMARAIEIIGADAFNPANLA